MSVICYFVFVRFIYSIWSFYYQVLVSVYKEKKEYNRVDFVNYLSYSYILKSYLYWLIKTSNVSFYHKQKLTARTGK